MLHKILYILSRIYLFLNSIYGGVNEDLASIQDNKTNNLTFNQKNNIISLLENKI